ncbi:hypothetical protein N566_24980 [Streptomycetaceae bacterium MP113-05]|nr:hypothetical protein N566_24980 [Streptomycetaceae bacterium MP113-05]
MESMGEPTGLANRLRALPPSCGPVRLVAVDGHAGSGKSTLADRLARALGGAPVVHLDEVASHAALFDWVDRLTDQVTGPLSRGETAQVEVYDWERRAYRGRAPVVPAEVVLLEGVGAGRRALRPLLAGLLWVDMSPRDAWERGRRRDGEALAGFWDRWTEAERDHFAGDPSYGFAHFLVREGRTAYEVRPGPAGLPHPTGHVTAGEEEPGFPAGRPEARRCGLDHGEAQELRFP